MRHICPLGCVKCFDGRFAYKMSDCTSDAGCMRSRGPVFTATATATAWITSSAAAVLCAQKCTITLNPSQRQCRRGWDGRRRNMQLQTCKLKPCKPAQGHTKAISTWHLNTNTFISSLNSSSKAHIPQFLMGGFCDLSEQEFHMFLRWWLQGQIQKDGTPMSV